MTALCPSPHFPGRTPEEVVCLDGLCDGSGLAVDVPALSDGIKGYTEWRKALWADEHLRQLHVAEGSKNPPRWDHRSVAEVIAMQGANGRGCFASLPYLAGILGCHANTVKSARAELLDRGWFVVTGKGGSTGRAVVLSIALPTSNGTTVRPNGTTVAGNGTTLGCLLPDSSLSGNALTGIA